MDTITSLVGKDYPMTTFALSSSQSASTDMLAALTAESVAISGVMSTIVGNMDTRLASLASSMGENLYKDPDVYGITDVRDWQLDEVGTAYVLSSLTGGTNSFDCDGDLTSTFTSGADIYCDNGVDGISRCVVGSSSYGIISGRTTVIVSEGTITSNLLTVYGVTNVHPSSDFDNNSYPDIKKWMSDFDFAYDHLNHPIGTTGTYGILARIAMLTNSLPTVDSNKVKQDAMDAHYREYTSWSPLVSVSAGTLTYIDENTFMCSGDLTSSLPISADLLIDCGADKQKGVKVLSSEYIPVSASDYTEVTLILNVYPYLESAATSALPVSSMNINFDAPDNPTGGFETISVSGTPVSGAVYVDAVTFYCLGDMTSTITSGTSAGGATEFVATFSPNPSASGDIDPNTFTTRYFTCYSSIHQSDATADHTIVKITDGLPITSNLQIVNIVGT